MAATTPDPFGGSGFWTGQQWVPGNHPLAQQGAAPTSPTAPTAPTAPAAGPAPVSGGSTPPAGAPADPFAAGGGGYWTGAQWVPKNHPLAQQAAGGSALTPGGATGGAAGTASNQLPGGTYQQGQGQTPTNDIQSNFRDALIGQLKTDVNNVNLTDPDLAPQARAFQNAQQRSQERLQQDLAEQGQAAGALGTGAYGSELRQLEQARGEGEAGFEAGLLKEGKAQRLQQLFDAMGIAGNRITDDEAIRVQRELGLGDINLRSSLGSQDISARMADIAMRERLGQGQLGLGTMEAMLRDRQANNSLGLEAALGGANLNYKSLASLLGIG